MYKVLNIIRKSEFMDSNLLQCDTPVAVLLLVAVALRAIGLSLARRPKCTIRKILRLSQYPSEAVFCSNMDSKVILSLFWNMILGKG